MHKTLPSQAIKIKRIIQNIAFWAVLAIPFSGQSQGLLNELDSTEEKQTEYVENAFKSTRIVNAQSLETLGGGVLDFRISHRFGRLNEGTYEFFGLDNATIRLGLEYGVTDWLMIGVGRSSFEKFYDGFVKAKILRQSTGKRNMPFTLMYFGSTGINTLKNSQFTAAGTYPDNYQRDPNHDVDFSERITYTHQLIIGRKFSEMFSLQLMPTMIHRNLVTTTNDQNDVYATGIGGRIKLTNRIALNADYFYILPGSTADNFKQPLSVGLDIETGGHVFQLLVSNSRSMVEKGFVAETTGDWLKGDIHFGFNISRVFSLTDKSRQKSDKW